MDFVAIVAQNPSTYISVLLRPVLFSICNCTRILTTQYKVFVSLVYLIVNRVGMVFKPYKFQNRDSAIHFDSTTTMHNLCFCVCTGLSNLQELFYWLVAPTQLKVTLIWARLIVSIHYSLFLF